MRKAFALLALCMSLPAGAQVTGVQVDLNGRPLRLVMPEGYCEVKRDTRFGRAAWHMQETLNENHNRVLLLFADCSELERKIADDNYRMRRHGNYLAPLRGGQVAPVPPGYTRARALAELKEGAPRLNAGEISNIVSERIRESEFDKQLRISGTSLGYLADDAAAVYLGLGMWLEAGSGEKVRINGVIAMTLVVEHVVSINLYDDFDEKALARLLEGQKSLARALISANP